MAVLAARERDAAVLAERDRRQPYVHADVRAIADRLAVVVTNSGPTVAMRVAVYFDPPIVRVRPGAYEIVHRLPVGMVPPGAPRVFPLAAAGRYFADPVAPRRFHVTVCGRGPDGPIPAVSYPVDAMALRQTVLERRHGEPEVGSTWPAFDTGIDGFGSEQRRGLV
ncbi:hypothetical protein [Glycomyces sp. YM15]|uniref:hypothetical protein n=1 Tax=Glycomyces sp. YM15 TaxID=2800446 RepID=UPI001962F365|nr:hypothetical protein [Glycomyces sp. YM15]